MTVVDNTTRGFYFVEAGYTDLLRSVGLADGQSVFENPIIRVWRSITERENCVLDHPGGRLHIKRNKPGQGGIENEIEGIRLLEKAGIGTVPVCGYGRLNDGRGFLITDHLAGFEDCQRKLESEEVDFDKLLQPTAELAARLHAARLHHRDLYLGHFFGDFSQEPPALRLIDAGRVRTLPRLLARRWIIKDLAQFIFSTQGLPISDAQRTAWLDCYAAARGITLRFRTLIDSKARQIARHDAALRRKNPTRNVAAGPLSSRRDGTSMKVLLVILHADPARGGAELYACHLAERLCNAGHDAHVAAATFAGVVKPHQRVPIEFDGPTRSARYRSFCNGLKRHLKDNQYDIVHAMLPVPRCDIYHPQAGVETISLQSGTPGKRFWGLIDFKRQAFARVEQRLVDGPNPPLVICMSERSRSETAGHFAIDPARLVTIYNGIDDHRFDPNRVIRKNRDRPTLLFIGHDYARKGLDTAIAALASVPHAVLRVLGNEKPGRFQQLARATGVLDRVQFAGPTPRVQDELASADALVLPARFEPFGMVVVEAMLMGVPPVVSSYAGAAEIVRHGIDGYIIPSPDDPAAWAEAINNVIAGNGTMRAACLARRQELSYEQHLQKLLAIYERIVHERAAVASA